MSFPDLFRRPRATGYIFVSGRKADARFLTAKEGDTIRNATRESPWIVVEHALDGVLITDWPGTLWEAEVVDALEPQDHTGNYTRSVAIRLVRRLPAHTLFGPHGEGVAWVAERARALTPEEAETLSEHRAPEAGRLYSKAWLNWKGLSPSRREFTDWEGIIGAGGETPVSPIGRGLSAVFNCVTTRAYELLGDDCMYTDGGPEDDPNLHLVEPWGRAALALCETAMALGAPDLLPADDRAMLTEAWRALTGPGLS
ncbi:MAG: hypothetical protein R3C13_06600 [Hyphomonas sp.]|uniref:hypothetical protein n=1 Tax=Hyphomonas sp. TaxID=87 RepID=UPI0035275B71